MEKQIDDSSRGEIGIEVVAVPPPVLGCTVVPAEYRNAASHVSTSRPTINITRMGKEDTSFMVDCCCCFFEESGGGLIYLERGEDYELKPQMLARDELDLAP